MFNLATAIPNVTKVIKVSEGTERVPVGTVLTLDQ